MRPQIILAVLSILVVLTVTEASFSSMPEHGLTRKEIAEFAVTTHNQLVLLHQLKLVSVDKFQTKVLVPNNIVIYSMVLTTADTVGIAKLRYEAVVKIVNLSSSGPSFKQLVSFLPKLA